MNKILTIYCLLSTLIFADLGVKKIAGGFDKPTYVLPVPGSSNKIIVLEQKGIARLVINGSVTKTPFLDIKDRVHRPLFPGDEMGFLGFAFDPNFNDNSYFYVHYDDKDYNTIISRFKVKEKLADKSSEKIILTLAQPYFNHNGGTIEFRKDGYLYIGLGDGGSAGDPEKRAQDPSNLFGKILRIDVNTEKPYLSPKSNPFVKYRKFKDEIWSYGLRNPWRFSFDALTGDMIIGDVGQYLWEEINIEYFGDEGGRNYGWNTMEGNHCYPEDAKDCASDEFTMPAFEYPNNANYVKILLGISQRNMDGCSITGGYVYRGKQIPDLYGRYIFGDYCTGRVWSIIIEDGVGKDVIEYTDSIRKSMGKREFYLSSFGQDNNNELFIIDYNGTIYKLINIK